MTIKIWITKWTLGGGKILCCEAEVDSKGYACYKQRGYDIFVGKTDYHLSEAEALKAVEEQRIRKLQSLDKQVNKVLTLKPVVQEI